MKRIILALGLVLGLGAPAFAESPVQSTTNESGFAGFYVGVLGGQTKATGSFSLTPYWEKWSPHQFTRDADGYQFGVLAGHNWQIGNSNWIAGIEADYFSGSVGMNNASVMLYRLDGGVDSFSISDQVTLRGKVGYDFNGVMPYVAAGASCADIQMKSSHWMFKAHSSSGTECGSSLAAGVEAMLGNGWSMRGEYRVNDYGLVQTDQVLVGIARHF